METAILVFFGLVLLILVVLAIRYWKQLREFKGEVQGEMTKVSWPTQQEVINSTILVFVVTIIMTLAVWIVDWILGSSMSGLFKILS